MIDSDGFVAASVTARRIRRPDVLPDGFEAVPNVVVQFYEITTVDGLVYVGALYRPEATARPDCLIVTVHGSGGSIAAGPGRVLAAGLSQVGYSVLAINTRGSGSELNRDHFYDVRNDLDAAYWVGLGLGYSNLFFHGHSLGTSQVAYFAATTWRPELVGVVFTGMFADLAWKSRHLLIGDAFRYDELAQEALAAVRSRKWDQALDSLMPWLRGQSTVVSAQHFVTYRWEAAAAAKSAFWVRRIPYPMLVVRDENDQIIWEFEQSWLEAAASVGVGGDATFHKLRSKQGSNGHGFEDSGEELVGLVRAWVDAKLQMVG